MVNTGNKTIKTTKKTANTGSNARKTINKMENTGNDVVIAPNKVIKAVLPLTRSEKDRCQGSVKPCQRSQTLTTVQLLRKPLVFAKGFLDNCQYSFFQTCSVCFQ